MISLITIGVCSYQLIMNTENCRILCVVCNQIQFKSKKNKTYKLFEVGFENNTLCYLKNLQNIIYLYFQM